MNKGEVSDQDLKSKLQQHFDKYGMVYKIVGTTVIILVAGGGFDYAFASDVIPASGLEEKASQLYTKLLRIGKWVIVFKGGFDTIKNLVNEDIAGAKKGFIGYLMIYLLLFALPWAMTEIDKIFQELV